MRYLIYFCCSCVLNLIYFRRFAREEGSFSSETSTGTTRGVLKRMAKVTSDDTQQASSSQLATAGSEEQQGVLGAGLPLIQRLKLLKDKEEREERERNRNRDETPKAANVTVSNIGPNKLKVEVVQDEPEVIGVGLPLFARLKLLKAKEEKERLDREKMIMTQRIIPDIITDDTSKEDSNDSVKENVSATQSVLSKKLPGQLKGLLRKAVLEKNSNGDQKIVPNLCEGGEINDLNKDTLATSLSAGNNNTISIKDLYRKSDANGGSKPNSTESEPKSDDSSGKKLTKSSSNEKSIDSDGNPKEGIQRSDSFRRAMVESLMSSDKQDFNINDSENDEKKKISSSSSSSSLADRKSIDEGSENSKIKNTNKSNEEKENVVQVVQQQRSLSRQKTCDDGSPEDNTAKKNIQPDFLKVFFMLI